MAFGRLAEVGGGRGRCLRDVNDSRWQLVYMTVFAHLKLAYRLILVHDAVSILIYITLRSTELAQGFDVAFPKAILIKAIKIIAAIINIAILSYLHCCY
jgi:hypothetical protein